MKKQTIKLNESQLRNIIKETINKVLNESNFNNFFDYYYNADAPDEEKELAGKKHDERIGSIYDEPDYLAQKQAQFDGFSKRLKRGNMTPSEFNDQKKFTMKNHRTGGKLYTDRLTKALTPNSNW